MNLLAALILYIVGARGAQHIPISKGSASLEIGAIKTASIHWVGTAVNITKRPQSIPTGAGTAHGGASQPSGNAAPPYLNVTLKGTTHCNPPYPNKTVAAITPGNPPYSNLTFSATTRPGIISPPYPNLTASASIWTTYKGPTSGRAIPTPASNSQTPISPGAQVIYTGASYRLGFSFGNAIISFFGVLSVFIGV